MDEVEAIKAARRALRNVRNGIEAREASLEEVEADRARHGRRLRELAVSASIALGSGPAAADVAVELAVRGIPEPFAAYDRIRPAAEARTRAVAALREAERECRERARLAKSASSWAQTCEEALAELREHARMTSLTEGNAGEALRFARRTGARRLLDRAGSPLARQVQARQRAAGSGRAGAVLLAALEKASSVRIARESAGAHLAACGEAEAMADAARAALVATPEPDARDFQRAVLRAVEADAGALEVVAGATRDGIESHAAAAAHPRRLDALEELLRRDLSDMRAVEAWLARVSGLETFPEAALRQLPAVDRAMERFAADEALSAARLAPGSIGDTIRAMDRSPVTPRARPAPEPALGG